MSSSTALLPKPRKDDHPIFLRVCHSPWISINQQLLVLIRGVIAVYMIVTFFMLLYFEKKRTDHGWLIPFELQIVSYLIQVIYFLAAFVSHLYVVLSLFPHHDLSISASHGDTYSSCF